MTLTTPTTASTSAGDDDVAGVVARGAPGAKPDVDTPGYRITWLFSGQRAPDAAQTLGYVVIQPGQKNPLHAHPNCEELLYLLSGQLDHSLEDRVFRLNPGDAIRVPAGVKHDARCVGDEPATMIVCYSTGQREMQAYE